jgi:hypothetical protein
MYAEIVRKERYHSRDEFGIEYWIEGEDRAGKPFEAIASFGFIYEEEDDGYYLACSVVWNGRASYDDLGQELITRESMESGQLKLRVRREMEELLRKMLERYPEFEDVERSLGWRRP